MFWISASSRVPKAPPSSSKGSTPVGLEVKRKCGVLGNACGAACGTTSLPSVAGGVATAGAAAAPASGELSQSEKLNLAAEANLKGRGARAEAQILCALTRLQLRFQQSQLGLPAGHLALES